MGVRIPFIEIMKNRKIGRLPRVYVYVDNIIGGNEKYERKIVDRNFKRKKKKLHFNYS